MQNQRADPQQLAILADQSGTAPERVRRRGVEGVVERVFPIAGEVLPADQGRLDRLLPPAAGGQDAVIAGPQPIRIADLQRRQIELAQRLHQREPGLLVDRQRVAGNGAAIVGVDPDRLRLGHQIADGDDQAGLLDHHAAALALHAQRGGGEGVLGDRAAQRHHGAQHPIQVERIVGWVRLQGGWNFRLGLGHAAALVLRW